MASRLAIEIISLISVKLYSFVMLLVSDITLSILSILVVTSGTRGILHPYGVTHCTVGQGFTWHVDNLLLASIDHC